MRAFQSFYNLHNLHTNTMQTALVQERTRFEFLGKEINLKSCVGFFITMNPGYAGRTELPGRLSIFSC